MHLHLYLTISQHSHSFYDFLVIVSFFFLRHFYTIHLSATFWHNTMVPVQHSLTVVSSQIIFFTFILNSIHSAGGSWFSPLHSLPKQVLISLKMALHFLCLFLSWQFLVLTKTLCNNLFLQLCIIHYFSLVIFAALILSYAFFPRSQLLSCHNDSHKILFYTSN